MLLTSSGIQNVPNSYFEAGKTLGAGKSYQIFRIAIPAGLIMIAIFCAVILKVLNLIRDWALRWQKGLVKYW